MFLKFIEYFIAAVVSLIPGILWLYYFYRKDIFEKEPQDKIVKVFLFGVISIIPAILVEMLASNIMEDIFETRDFWFNTIDVFLVVGPIEELCKFAAVYIAIYHDDDFNEPMDGIIYSIAASSGFASIENFFYTVYYGLDVISIRAILATLAHLTFGAMWGYALGRAKFEGDELWGKTVKKGLLLAILLHGLYDFILLNLLSVAIVGAGLLIYYLFRQTQNRITENQRISPFRDNIVRMTLICPKCDTKIAYQSAKCQHCGHRIDLIDDRAIKSKFCGNCNTEFKINQKVKSCPNCSFILLDEKEL